jgi:hypothetical protein
MIEFCIDLAKDFSSFFFLHVFSPLLHPLKLLLKFGLLIAAVLAELDLFFVEPSLFVNQSCDHHDLVLLDT